MSRELLQRQFEPIGLTGENPVLKRKGEILAWVYKPENIPDGLIKDFVVAKTPGYGDQYIFGNTLAVEAMAKAFNITDSLGMPDLRAASVFINPYASKRLLQTEEVYNFLNKTFARFGIYEKIRGSEFNSDIVNTVGVKPDTRKTIIRFYDYFAYPGWENYKKTNFVSILYVSDLVHERQHILQKHEGLPVNSLWAERNAMSEESKVLFSLLNNYPGITKHEQDYVAKILRYKSKRIFNYRNGLGFEDHLLTPEDYSDGTPNKHQTLHLEDFCFGS